MRRMLYCWRCRKDVPMLEEHEWALVFPPDAFDQMGEHLRTRGTAGAHELKNHLQGEGALDRYYQITGVRETDSGVLWHHSQLGPPCGACGKPLRTQRAKLCAACGALR